MQSSKEINRTGELASETKSDCCINHSVEQLTEVKAREIQFNQQHAAPLTYSSETLIRSHKVILVGGWGGGLSFKWKCQNDFQQ